MLFVVSVISSCGGSGGSQSVEETPTKIIEPIIELPPEKCTYADSGENNGVPYSLSTESQYTGDIKFNCSFDSNQPTAQQYFLINGVPSLNIVNLKRETIIASDCTVGSAAFKDSLEVSFDYNTGVVNTSSESTLNGVSSCTSKYASPLETTLSSQDSIKILFDTWGVDVSEANMDKTGLIETNCPQIPNSNHDFDGVPVCKFVIEDKYTVTDDSDKVHTLEKKISY